MQTPMFGKRRYRLIGIIAFVGIALILIKSFQKAPVDTIRTTPFVETATVRWDSSNVKRSYSGEVRGYYEIPLAFQVGGKISKRHVNPGSIVRAGDLLLAINSQDIEQVVKIATAQLDAAGSKLKVAENTLNRSRELYQAAALSQDALEKAQDAMPVLRRRSD